MQIENDDPFSFESFKQAFDENEADLVENAPPDVWAVLLFLSNNQKTDKRVILTSKDDPKLTNLSNFRYTIGRSKSCDIRIESPTVSNKHCIIYKIDSPEGETVFIEDTSSNGTFVDEKKIPKDTPYKLTDESVVRMSKGQPGPNTQTRKQTIEFTIQIIKERKKSSGYFSKNYMTKETLGKGAFAEVKLVVNRMSGEHFAVKIIDKSRVEEHKRLLTNFDSEKSILGRVKHPTIIRVKAIYHEERYFYVVLDLAKGGELFDRIVEQGHFTEDETRIVMLQLLLGLYYLHKQGIVHRDIKPENILLADYEGLRVQLADFGLAKIVGEQSFMKTLCGTPMYVAPEVLKARGSRMYGNKVDIWSLGVVLYICLFGFPPFSDDLSPPPMNQQIMQGLYSFPSPHSDRISQQAIRLIKSMLCVDPEKRISAKQALLDPWLRAYQEGTTWRIKGISDFVFEEPYLLSEEESTQTLSHTSSSAIDSQIGISPVSVNSISNSGNQIPGNDNIDYSASNNNNYNKSKFNENILANQNPTADKHPKRFENRNHYKNEYEHSGDDSFELDNSRNYNKSISAIGSDLEIDNDDVSDSNMLIAQSRNSFSSPDLSQNNSGFNSFGSSKNQEILVSPYFSANPASLKIKTKFQQGLNVGNIEKPFTINRHKDNLNQNTDFEHLKNTKREVPAGGKNCYDDRFCSGTGGNLITQPKIETVGGFNPSIKSTDTEKSKRGPDSLYDSLPNNYQRTKHREEKGSERRIEVVVNRHSKRTKADI
ncbi:hypothetical protein BB558_004537 [Smittium angustum]|uniref:Uncharacterized protein n=1 Tax=Smittium angustum TaxID=133377 RepID=A0A2U1J337_SMIAN|nr:hypothetical protein BB558_004537 [Smittium angustum]